VDTQTFHPAHDLHGVRDIGLLGMHEGILLVVHAYDPARDPQTTCLTGLGRLTNRVTRRIREHKFSQDAWRRLAFIIEDADAVGVSLVCKVGEDDVQVSWTFCTPNFGVGHVDWLFTYSTGAVSVSWEFEQPQVHPLVIEVITGKKSDDSQWFVGEQPSTA
jgi:hypothetical protein